MSTETQLSSIPVHVKQVLGALCSLCGQNTHSSIRSYFVFNDTATTEIYTLSLHDALPIWPGLRSHGLPSIFHTWKHISKQKVNHLGQASYQGQIGRAHVWTPVTRPDLVCRLLLEKKKITVIKQTHLSNLSLPANTLFCSISSLLPQHHLPSWNIH